jgi:hypothetical protein
MSTRSGRTIGLAVVALALASGAAEAQIRRQGNGTVTTRQPTGTVYDGRSADGVYRDRDRNDRNRDGDRDWDRDRRDRDHDRDRDRDRDSRYQNGKKVPPGLAKKPGQMPPGQYKKRYSTSQGADVLGGVLRRRGYPVTRIATANDSRYVYYRLSDGSVRRAIVSPGADRLGFSNLPNGLLQEVLAALYY